MIIPPKGVLLTSSCGNAYGSNCVFGCESGYGSVDGNVTRTCLESSLWSGENINCTGTGTSLSFYFLHEVTTHDQQKNKEANSNQQQRQKLKKKSLHQNCENPLAKGFLTSTISSNDTEGVHFRTSIITSFCFSFLIIWFFLPIVWCVRYSSSIV